MVSRPDRQKACELIEKLANFGITNDDFDEGYPRRSPDRALEPIFVNIWFFYSDTHTHKLTGKHALSSEGHQLFRRCAAFLRSNLEYEWPDYEWIAPKRILIRLLGRRRKLERQFEQFKVAGDFDVWPFLRRSDSQSLNEKSDQHT